MATSHRIRRVTKRTYDQYNYSDYSLLPDSLNPINPTQLETQYADIVQAVKKKVIEAYEKVQIEPPKELFNPDVSPTTLLNNVNDLINKIKGNPLKDLYDDLGSFDALAPFLSAPEKANDMMNNPLKLDCSGIESTLSPNKSSDDDDGGSGGAGSGGDGSSNTGDGSGNGGANGQGDGLNSNSALSTGAMGDDGDKSPDFTIKLEYKNLLNGEENDPKYPKEILESECPVTLAIPSNTPTDQTFAGWYYDGMFSQKVPRDSLDWPGKDLVLYARFIDADDDDDDDGGDTVPNDNFNAGFDDRECDLIDLSFLKIILIIITVAKILIQVLITVTAIMKTVAEVVKEAQLCWINPPLLTSIIGYVMQRLAAVVFQLLGMILLKLWAMLNLDCISRQSVDLIAQINAALAGISDVIGSIDSLAIDFGSIGSAGNSLKEAFKSLGKQLKDQSENLWNDMKNYQEKWKALGTDLAETYTNPATYLAAVPPEIKRDIVAQIDGINSIKASIANMKGMVDKLAARNSKVQNTMPKGVEIVTFS